MNEKNVDNTSASQQDLYFFPPAFSLPKSRSAEALKIQSAPVIQINTGSTDKDNNPFLFGNFKDNYVDGNFFRKYNPNYFTGSDENKKSNLDSKGRYCIFDLHHNLLIQISESAGGSIFNQLCYL